MRICIYAASSAHCDPAYHADARALGRMLAEANCTLVYGGGAVGSMGAVADGALEAGGEVIGIIPRFMVELEWAHQNLSALQLVEDMRERKHRLLTGSDAVIALPGGCGTLEELFEAITLKRLGIFLGPIVLVNTRKYFAPLLELLAGAVRERFMDERHLAMWQVVAAPEEVLAALAAAPPWSADMRRYATL